MPRKPSAPAESSLYSVHPSVAYRQTIIANLPEKTGQSLAEWIRLIEHAAPVGEQKRRQWLKEEHHIGGTTATLIVEAAEGKVRDATDPEAYLRAAPEYVAAMYAGPKSALRPVHDALIEIALALGKDVRICPCQTIVPLYRQHVFAEIKPTTRTRIDLGLALRGIGRTRRLIDTGGMKKGNRITHRFPLSAVEDVDAEVKQWLQIAYDLGWSGAVGFDDGMGFMKLCVSEATTMAATFAEDVAAHADAGCSAMEAWLTKLEQHLETNTADATRELLAEKHVSLTAAAYQGGLLLSQGEERRAHFTDFKGRLDLCQQFGIGTLLVVADIVPAVERIDLQRAVVSLKQAAQWAAGFDVRLALEFRKDNKFCASLATAAALVAACDEPNVGVCFDVFHYYTGPSKFEDLGLLTRDNLAFVQLSDLAGVPRELALDVDRIMPGDGDFQLGPIVQHLRRIGYDGWVSLELFNPQLWENPAAQVIELGLMALRRVLAE